MTIIDRNKKFIYLKSHKTAGTSTEVYLITQTALGSDIYRTSKDIEKYGFAKKRRDREFASFKRALPDPRHSVSDWILATKLKFGSKMRVREHMTGDDVLDLVGRDFFDQCSVVTNVRNPWDALVSSYKWQRGGRGGASRPVEYSFPEFLSWSLGVGDNGISIAEEYLFHPYISGRGWMIDRVIFFEDLAHSIDDTLSVFGVDSIGFENASIYEKRTRKKEDYRLWYSDIDAYAVEERFSSFLSLFRYDFNSPGTPPMMGSQSVVQG
jgi:hypothetical protein